MNIISFLRKNIYRNCLQASVNSPALYHLSLIVFKGTIFLLKPFSGNKFVYNLITPFQRYLGYSRAVAPGDVVVKAGIVPESDSELFRIARALGHSGTVIAIEPDPVAIQTLKNLVIKSRFGCRFIFVNKAVYSSAGATTLCLGGSNGSWNRLKDIPGTSTVSRGVVEIQMDTIDNILAEAGIMPNEVRYVNLTINGAEYEALKGMTSVLTESHDLLVTVIAGRQGDKNLETIAGQPDYVTISNFLGEYGLQTKFKRFRWESFGFVIGTKGNKKNFM